MESQTISPCEDEIDLRELALTLWRGKWVLVLATLGIALAALAFSLTLPKKYLATTIVAITPPKIQQRAQNGLVLAIDEPDLKTVTQLAQSAAVFQALAADAKIQAAWKTKGSPLTWQALAGEASVSAVGKNGLKLTIRDTDPQRAALIANQWAAQVAAQINAHYGFAAVVGQIADAAHAAYSAYQDAEEAYKQALAQSQQVTLKRQLEQTESSLSCVLARQRNIQRLQRDLQTLDDYLRQQDANATLSPGDALVLATLQQRALASKVCMTDTISLQTQWQAADLASLTVSKARSLVQEMQTVLQQRAAALPTQQTQLEHQITQLQQALETDSDALRKNESQRDTAWSTYRSLLTLQAQAKALAMSSNQTAEVAARAVIPTSPSSPRVVMNVALGGVLGVMLGLMGILIAGWWKENKDLDEETNA